MNRYSPPRRTLKVSMPSNPAPDRRLRPRKGGAVRLQPDHRVAFVAHPRKVPVVDPVRLQKLERGHRLGADEEEKDAARHLIIFL